MQGLPIAPFIVDAFIKHVESGQPLSAAAALAGIAPRTVQYWLEFGRKEPNGRYGIFARRFERARDLSLAGYIAEVRKIGCNSEKPDWRAAAWLGERIHREKLWLNYGQANQTSVVNINVLSTPTAQLPERQAVVREIEGTTEVLDNSRNVPDALGS